jgi:hypothetical protein
LYKAKGSEEQSTEDSTVLSSNWLILQREDNIELKKCRPERNLSGQLKDGKNTCFLCVEYPEKKFL